MSDRFLPSRDVRARYGVSDMALFRWMRDSEFPQPARFNKRRYWREADLIAWERKNVTSLLPIDGDERSEKELSH